jgi:hypothetical protein
LLSHLSLINLIGLDLVLCPQRPQLIAQLRVLRPGHSQLVLFLRYLLVLLRHLVIGGIQLLLLRSELRVLLLNLGGCYPQLLVHLVDLHLKRVRELVLLRYLLRLLTN